MPAAVSADRSPFKVAVFAPAYPPAYLGGGPVRTLEALVEQAPDDIVINVIAPNKDIDGSELVVSSDRWVKRGNSSVLFVAADQLSRLSRGFWKLRATRPDAIYLNSFFDLRMSIVPQFLARIGYWRSAKVLVAPRGEFNSGALAIRSARKRLFLGVYRLLGMQRNVLWHGSSETEAAAVRTLWGQNAQVLIREDETNLPKLASPPIPHDGRLHAVFLGRVVPIKGLLTAINALALSTQDILFDVYGPEEDPDYSAKCRAAAGRVSTNVEVAFHGPLARDGVRDKLQRSDVMLMPTKGENFGHVIAEALSVSCPVICSDETPWSEVLRAGGGAVIESPDPSSWRAAIDEFASASASDRESRRKAAGAAYNSWQNGPKGDHVLALLKRLPE